MVLQNDVQLDGSDAFTAVVRDSDGVTLIELRGELDIATAGPLRDALVALDLNGGLEVRMDLTNLTFIDSAGVSVIASACKRVRASNGTFSVRCQGPVRRVFEIEGLVEFLELDEDGQSR